MKIVLPLAAAALLATATPASAQKGDVEKRTAELTEAKLAFGKQKAIARERALKRFDATIVIVNNSGQPASVKVALIKEWERKKQRFEQEGEWPGDEDLLGAGAEYGAALARHFVPVSQAYERLIKAHGAANDRAGADRALADRVTFQEAEFPGRAALKPGARYHGTRYAGKGATPFHLNISEVTGDVFRGVVHLNPGFVGHPIFEVAGRVEGPRVGCNTTKVVQGKAQALAFEGFVLGGHMVLRIGGVAANGRPAGGFAFLRLVGGPKKGKK